jgi:myosin heavy subunit
MGYGWGDDKLEYMVMRDAMTTVGITEPDQIDAMRVLAAALHLGRTSPL